MDIKIKVPKRHKCPKPVSKTLVSKAPVPKTSSQQDTSTIKRTTSKNKAVKKTSYKYFDEYRDLFTQRMTPVPESFLDKLALQIIEWAKVDPRAINPDKFWFTKGISPKTTQRWRKRYKPLDDAYESAKHMCGLRREEGAIFNEMNAKIIEKSAPIYLPEWKKNREEEYELRQKQDERTQQNNIKWMLGKFPDSKLVPPKKDDNTGVEDE